MKSLKELRSMPMAAVKSAVRMFILKGLAIILFLGFALWSAINIYDYAINRYACHIEWRESDIEYKYTYRGGCLLKLDKGWIPAVRFRVE